MQKKKGYRKRSRFYMPLFEVPNSDHPLFRLVRKRIKWAKTHDDAKRHSRRFVILRVWVILGLWFVWVFSQAPNNIYAYGAYFETGLESTMWLFGFSLMLSYLFDLAIVVYTMNSISAEINLRRWDLLTLAMDETRIIRAKYELGTLRTWRLYLTMLSVRISVVLMIFITFIGLVSIDLGRFTIGVEPNLVGTVGVILLVPLATSYYLLEPFWRVRASTSMGVTLSARTKHTVLTTFYGFIVVFGNWMVQVVWFSVGSAFYAIFVGIVFGGIVELFPLAELDDEWSLVVVLFFYIIYLSLITWLYYQNMEKSSFDAIRARFK